MEYQILISNEELTNNDFNDNIELCAFFYDKLLRLDITDKEKIDTIFSNKKILKKCINNFKNIENLTDEEKKLLDDTDIDNFFDKVEYVRFDNNVDVLKYLEENPTLLTKKIILPNYYSFENYTELLELKLKYQKIYDRIYINFEGNSETTSLEIAINTIETIKKQIDEIRNLNLSPMETILYVYDFVRLRIYKHEDAGASYKESRDITNVLLGDKIVCLEYAKIFKSILEYLGIKNNICELYNKNQSKPGHARNVIYVKDEKYNIDGIYYFDTTWDSKRNEYDNNYLYSYKYFARTKDYMEQHNSNFYDIEMPNSIDDIYIKLKTSIINDNYGYIIKNKDLLLKSLFKYANRFSETTPILIKMLSNQVDKDELLKTIEEIYYKYKSEISANTMFDLILNVRKIEYYQHPEIYPFSIEDMRKIFMNNDWIWTGCYIAKMLGLPVNLEEKALEELEMHLDDEIINQIRLTKVLRKYLEKNTNY